ncbi:hypothetical protein [Streptococcus sp. S784/96/1]|nr:hypothetical protein [Streptococcus sp. S784/96/1]
MLSRTFGESALSKKEIKIIFEFVLASVAILSHLGVKVAMVDVVAKDRM